MFTSLFARPWIARSALISLVAGSVLVGSTPANATGLGPVAPVEIDFDRSSTDGNIVIKGGESMTLLSQTEITQDWAGWPMKKGAKLTRSAFTSTSVGAVEQTSLGRFWDGVDPEDYEGCGFWDDAVGHTMGESDTCVRYLRVGDQVQVTNTTGSPKNLTTNTMSQVLKNGKSTLTGQEGVNSWLIGQVAAEGASVETSTGDSSIDVRFRGCIDESLLDTNGEDLTIEVAVTRNGTALERGTDYDLSFNDGITDDYTDPTLITYSVPSVEDNGGALENYEVNVQAWVNREDGGTYTGTLSVKNSSNQSVLEACPSNNEDPTFPTSIGHVDYSAQPAITISSAKSLPSHTDQTKDDFSLYTSSADGFGGMFYLTYASDPYGTGNPPLTTIVHMNSTGADESFNDSTGVLSTPVGRYGQLDIGRYDANGSKWFTIAPSSTSWSIKKGSMTTGAVTTTTISSKTLAKSCPKGYKPIYLSGMAAPTANPLAWLLCTKGQQMSSGVVSLTPTGATLLKQLGSATSARPCVIPQFGMNPSASAGTDIALVVYTRTSSKSPDEGSCGAVGATTTARAITTISQSGAVVTTSVSGNPWGVDGEGVNHEPGSAELAPVNDQGTSWIGISTTAAYNGEPSFPDYTFTISNAATSPSLNVDTSDTVSFDNDFGQWTWVRPLYKVSDSSWLVTIQGETNFDGETTAKYGVSQLNVTTGQITDGQVGTMSGFGPWVSGRIGSTLSVKYGKADGAYWYVLNDAEHYKVATWSYSIE
jgi:hypothetical protein